MRSYRISEVADQTGFSSSTVRYYEEIGVIPPARRTDAGYRVYDERSVGRLAFVARAKRLGLKLDEISDLTKLWDGDDCAGVQLRMADLVAARLAETHGKVAELVAFAGELDAVAAHLAGASHGGSCDETCACNRDAEARKCLPDEPVSCSLPATDLPRRIFDWRSLLAQATSRESIAGGTRFLFPAGAGLAGIVANLAESEVACCAFFDFTLGIGAEDLTLDVRGPSNIDVLIDAL